MLPENIKFKKLIEKYSLLKNLRPELLTWSLEAEKYYADKRISLDALKQQGFSNGEFEYRLTTDPEEEKYLVSAFWKKEEISEGEKVLENWKDFVK